MTISETTVARYIGDMYYENYELHVMATVGGILPRVDPDWNLGVGEKLGDEYDMLLLSATH